MRSVKTKTVNKFFRTICEVHREMYDILAEEKDLKPKASKALIDLLDEAYNMGKKMDNKLRQYKFNYDDDWWEKTKNVKEKIRKRKDR